MTDRFVLLEVRSKGRKMPKPSGTDVLMTGDLEDIEEFVSLKTGRGMPRSRLYSDGGDKNDRE